MSALFLELARTVLFLSSYPHMFRLRMVVLAPHGEVAKTLPVVGLATHKLFVSVDAVVGVELLATTLAGKQMATVLPNFVLARHLQRLESFVTDITEVNPISLRHGIFQKVYTGKVLKTKFYLKVRKSQ